MAQPAECEEQSHSCCTQQHVQRNSPTWRSSLPEPSGFRVILHPSWWERWNHSCLDKKNWTSTARKGFFRSILGSSVIASRLTCAEKLHAYLHMGLSMGERRYQFYVHTWNEIPEPYTWIPFTQGLTRFIPHYSTPCAPHPLDSTCQAWRSLSPIPFLGVNCTLLYMQCNAPGSNTVWAGQASLVFEEETPSDQWV